MFFKEEIEITEEDKLIIDKLGELLSISKIDDYFYTHDQELFAQLKVFTDEFEEAYTKGFGKWFMSKDYYRWVRNNVINKFTALLEALFKGLLEQFEDSNEDGVLTYKNNCRGYRTYTIVTQSEQQAETTQEVNSRILELNEVKLYENNMLQIEDNLIQKLECYYIRVEQENEVASIIRKELVEELRTMLYQRMCSLLEANFKRANCVEEIQYRLMLGILIGVIDDEFKPRFKSENNYNSFEVAKGVTVNLKSEFDYFKAVYHEFTHGNRNLIRI